MGLTTTVQEDLTKTNTQDVSYAVGAPMWFSLHSADPGGTGAHEVTSGTGAAGRQELTFAGSSGTDHITAGVSFTLTSATVTWVGYWTAQTGGAFLGGFPLVGTGSILAATSGSSTLNCPAHGLSVNETVRLFTIPGSLATGIPAGFTADTLYYVKMAPDANHITLSAMLGGSPISASSSAACALYVDEGVYATSGELTFPASTGITYVTTS